MPSEVWEAIEKWNNSEGFASCDETECFDDVYRIAAFFMDRWNAEHEKENN